MNGMLVLARGEPSALDTRHHDAFQRWMPCTTREQKYISYGICRGDPNLLELSRYIQSTSGWIFSLTKDPGQGLDFWNLDLHGMRAYRM